MNYKPQSRYVCILAMLCAMSFGQAPTANAQGCDELEVAAANELDVFLEKTLIFDVSSRTKQLISDWRAEYNSNAILSDKWAEVLRTLPGDKLATDQAEIDYLEALDNLRVNCPNGN